MYVYSISSEFLSILFLFLKENNEYRRNPIFSKEGKSFLDSVTMDEPLKLQCLLAREPAHSELDEQNLRFPPFLKKKKKKKEKKRKKTNCEQNNSILLLIYLVAKREREREGGKEKVKELK